MEGGVAPLPILQEPRSDCAHHLHQFRFDKSRGPGSRGRESFHCGTPKSWWPPVTCAPHAVRPASRTESPDILARVFDVGYWEGVGRSLSRNQGVQWGLSRCSTTSLNHVLTIVAAKAS